MKIEELTYKILECAFRVHSKLGPGLLESVYEFALAYELKKMGFIVEMQKRLPVYYDDHKLDLGYRIDLLVNGKVIIEIKAVETVHPVHHAQILTYLKLSDCQIGLLLNFNVSSLKDGIKRFVNNYQE